MITPEQKAATLNGLGAASVEALEAEIAARVSALEGEANLAAATFTGATRQWAYDYSVTPSDYRTALCTGGGTVDVIQASMRVVTAGTAGSVSDCRTGTSRLTPYFKPYGIRANAVWSRPTILKARFFIVGDGVDTVFRLMLGKFYNDDSAATDLTSANNGIGFKITNLALVAQFANGTTLTTSETLATLANLASYDITISCPGDGTWQVYLQDTLVGSGTGAPTATLAGYDALQRSLTNGTTAASKQVAFTKLQLTQF